MKLTFLGTGTSYGVPFIGCDCTVCRSDDPRDKRLRPSILLEADDTRLLIDTTPDLRQQLLRAKVNQISAVLWTHGHNDHVIGLDDIRPITDRQGYIPGYADAQTIARLRTVFDYIFQPGQMQGGFPRMTGHVLAPYEPLQIGAIQVTPLPIMHGKREIFAFRFDAKNTSLVYATDCSAIAPQPLAAMRGAETLVLGALRHKAHPNHFNLEQALEVVAQLQPKQAFFTHIAHDLGHEATSALLPPNARLAFDTLEIE